MSKKWKIGIIGAHGRGKHAYKAHQPENGIEIVMGADPFEPSPFQQTLPDFKSFKETFPEADLVTDYRDVLKNPEIDMVFIMSPDFCHEEQAIAALEAGKAVYLEKPLAITIEGCDRILQTAYRTKSKLFVGHNMRHFPVVLKMKEVIDSGIIGDIQCGWCRHFIAYGGDAYFRDWHSEQKNTCGLLLQKGAHDIDIMHWLMGSRPLKYKLWNEQISVPTYSGRRGCYSLRPQTVSPSMAQKKHLPTKATHFTHTGIKRE